MSTDLSYDCIWHHDGLAWASLCMGFSHRSSTWAPGGHDLAILLDGGWSLLRLSYFF